MDSYALFRYPDQSVMYMAASSTPMERLVSMDELRGKRGFVMAPFRATDDCPILLLRDPDIRQVTARELQSMAGSDDTKLKPIFVQPDRERVEYKAHFLQFHKQLTDGRFRKIVLSRHAEVQTAKSLNPIALFQRACKRYPHQYIMLFVSPDETWLMATPERLVSGAGDAYNTVALAGTQVDQGIMPIDACRWEDKDREEQRIVARYIGDILGRYAGTYRELPVRTVKAAHLLHLLSDFLFTLPPDSDIVSLVSELHPTPAVCGIPKEETRHFIIDHEGHRRRYYSGFAGYISRDETHLYVSLRCMEIGERRCWLYAGGGLLADSIEEREWQETTAKLDTMYRLLNEEE